MIKSIFQIPGSIKGLWLSVLFSILCLSAYEWGLFRKEKLRRFLENKIDMLANEYRTEKAAYLELYEQINGQNEPEFIELTLKKTLGVTRAEETKIVFRVKE